MLTFRLSTQWEGKLGKIIAEKKRRVKIHDKGECSTAPLPIQLWSSKNYENLCLTSISSFGVIEDSLCIDTCLFLCWQPASSVMDRNLF